MRWAVLHDPRGGRLLVEVAETRRERRRGLLGRPPLPAGRGLLLPGARSVHTFGMRRTLGVVVLDARFRVLGVRLVAPARLTLPRPGARHTLEVEVRDARRLRAGDQLRLDALGDAGGWGGRRRDP